MSQSVSLTQIASNVRCDADMFACGPFNASNAHSSSSGKCLSSQVDAIATVDMNGTVISCWNAGILTPDSVLVDQLIIYIVGTLVHSRVHARILYGTQL